MAKLFNYRVYRIYSGRNTGYVMNVKIIAETNTATDAETLAIALNKNEKRWESTTPEKIKPHWIINYGYKLKQGTARQQETALEKAGRDGGLYIIR